MAVMLSMKPHLMAAWRDALLALDPTLDIRMFPETGAPEQIEAAVCWSSHDMADLLRYPNLKLICSMGAGVDHLLRAPGPPPGIPVARLVDVMLTTQMGEWVLLNVLRFHRQDINYRAQQTAGIWDELEAPVTAKRRVGILGLGALGSHAAAMIGAVGFPVSGWSRRAKTLPGARGFAGADGLTEMVRQTDILVCLLPLTPATRGIIDARLIADMPRGAFIINGARGGHVVDADLLAALDAGHIAGAALDVFEPEPLPATHRYWSHPSVIMTPHAASITIPESAAPQVVANIRRALQGEPIQNLVDMSTGY